MSEPFDFDAFIRGTNLARGTVAAYRVDHRDEIARLTREHDALPDTTGDERESDTPSPRHALAERIAALRDEMEQSKVEWRLRTLTPEEFATIPDEDEEKERQARGEMPSAFRQLSMQSSPPADSPNPSAYRDLPNLTAEQWREISRVIGFRQWGDVVNQASALVVSRVAVPDFSRSVSQTLSPQEPSES